MHHLTFSYGHKWTSKECKKNPLWPISISLLQCSTICNNINSNCDAAIVTVASNATAIWMSFGCEHMPTPRLRKSIQYRNSVTINLAQNEWLEKLRQRYAMCAHWHKRVIITSKLMDLNVSQECELQIIFASCEANESMILFWHRWEGLGYATYCRAAYERRIGFRRVLVYLHNNYNGLEGITVQLIGGMARC